MARWGDVEVAAPDLAARVQQRLGVHRHTLLATLRRDGSPRLSGIETQFVLGELWLGMMHRSRKGADLRYDARLALHSAPDDVELAQGDAKVAGRGVEVVDAATIDAWLGTLPEAPPRPFDLFRVEVTEVSLVRVEGDHLVIEWWREGDVPHQIERR